MDVLRSKWISPPNISANRSQDTIAAKQHGASHSVSVSSLGSKLRQAQQAIENPSVYQPHFRNEQAASHTEDNRSRISAAKLQFENLSKADLETIIAEPKNIFESTEKQAAMEKWRELDQSDLSNLKQTILADPKSKTPLSEFENALDTHINALSPIANAMLDESYRSEATAQFQSTLDQLNTKASQTTEQSQHYYDVMVKELFGGTEPKVKNGATGMSLDNLTTSYYEFLTGEDRQLLADIYEYADQNEIDFQYIRRLASDLGDYRKHDNGRLLNNFNTGHFDSEGHKLTVSFPEKTQAIIDDMETSGASGRLDQGFLSFITEPGTGALSHVGNFEFLQHVAEVTAGMEPSIGTDEFTQFKEFKSRDERYIITASEEKTLFPEPDVTCVNGVCEVTEKGRRNGVTLEGETPPLPPSLELNQNLLDTLLQRRESHEQQENIWFKWFVTK